MIRAVLFFRPANAKEFHDIWVFEFSHLQAFSHKIIHFLTIHCIWKKLDSRSMKKKCYRVPCTDFIATFFPSNVPLKTSPKLPAYKNNRKDFFQFPFVTFAYALFLDDALRKNHDCIDFLCDVFIPEVHWLEASNDSSLLIDVILLTHAPLQFASCM